MPRRSRGQFLPNHTRMRGTVLTVALIFLIVLTLLGISVMNVSQQELKMAGQFAQQSRVQTQAEDCLKTAESAAAAQVDAQLNHPGGTLPHIPGFLDVANGTAAAAVGDASWWDDQLHTLPCAANGRYVIEYLGAENLVLPEDRYTGRTHPMHVFRITARGTSGTEASVMLQTIFLRNST
jgi:type IV pilus assembly protein PilX